MLASLANRPSCLAFPVPRAPTHPLPHLPAPSAGKRSKGLFSRMGSENSALFVLAAVSFPVEEVECPRDRGGPQDATWRGRRRGGGGGGVSKYRSLSNRVRGQLQQRGCQCGGQVFQPNFCTLCFGYAHVFPLPLWATDGTEVGIHQLHDLSQLPERKRGRSGFSISLALLQEGGAARCSPASKRIGSSKSR